MNLKNFKNEYKHYFSSRVFLIPFITGWLFLTGSLFINYIAGTYATDHISNSVTDLILNAIPVMDVDGFFIYGAIIFWIFAIVIVATKPRQIPYALKTIALFVVIRSVFISLTHLGPFPTQAPIHVTNFLARMTFAGDLFFSGHTGLPFLFCLMFWQNWKLRYIFLICAFAFAVIVLAGHYHYSIDVLAAFFITYAINDMAEIVVFKKDRRLFEEGIS